MSIEINQKFIEDVRMDDKLYYEALIAELEALIETELTKNNDEINDGFIDECCIAIEYLRSVQSGEETGSYKTMVDIESMIKSEHRRTRILYVSSAACAAVAVLCAVFSLRSDSTDEQSRLRPYGASEDSYKEAETKGNDSTEEPVTTPIQQSTEDITIIEPVSTSEQVVTDIIPPPNITQPVPVIYRLDVIAKPGTCLQFEDESLIDLSGVDVVVSYSDNSTETVPIEECQLDIGTADENGKVKVTVTYKHMSTDIYVTIE